MKKSNPIENKNMESEKIQADMEHSKDTLIRGFIVENCRSGNLTMKQFISHIEREMIQRALRLSAGNQKVASFILGVKPTTLNEKIRKYDIKGFKRTGNTGDMKKLVRHLIRTSSLI